MKKRFIASLSIAVALAAVALLLFKRGNESSDVRGVTAGDTPAPAGVAAKASSEETAPLAQPDDSASPPETALEPTEAVKQMRSMVAAHASLRSPEVADPDSETNKRIMQKMVMQAFDNAKSDPRQ